MRPLTLRRALESYAFYLLGMELLMPLVYPGGGDRAAFIAFGLALLGGTAANVLLWIVGHETKIEPCPQPKEKRFPSTARLSR
jgi:hypothetical protein